MVKSILALYKKLMSPGVLFVWKIHTCIILCRSTIMAALQKAGLAVDILFMLLSVYNAV